MPVLYSAADLAHHRVPTVDAIRQAPFLIRDALEGMYEAGEIHGATSFGSLFMPHASINCASDVDWLVLFRDTDAMLHSGRWRALRREMAVRHMSFGVPALSLEQVRSGNHTLCSLLHGIRSATTRIITGEDPLVVFERYGAGQQTALTTLQLFGSMTRFFFENYAHLYGPDMEETEQLMLLGQAVSIWKDVLSTMLVRGIGAKGTIPLRWDLYVSRYAALLPAEVLRAGEKVATFLTEYRATMEEYDRLRHTGGNLDSFAEDYRIFLREYLEVIPAAARFAEANISLYRRWATPMRHRAPWKVPSHPVANP